ncbi:MAG: hypothetical protein RL117_1535 [Verrucomicrobiota bacterium]|jgi:hypothetical protein
MKSTTLLATTILSLSAMTMAYSADDHDHDHEKHVHEENVTKGPNGGHVIHSKAGFSFEVTVDKERKAHVVFIDSSNKPIAAREATITGIAGERSAPTKLTFAKGSDMNVLVSDVALPAGDHVPMILMIKPTPTAKASVERFELHLH